MNKIVQFPGNTRIREEAAWWLVSLEEGLTDEEKPRLAGWLAADPAHREALVEQARLWDELDLLSELAGVYPLESGRQVHTAGHATRRRALAAAGIAVAVFGGWLIATQWPTLRVALDHPPADAAITLATPSPAIDPDARQYRTRVGEQMTVALPDGSTVFINTDSVLDVHYTATGRDIRLSRGEAMFNVAPDPGRPFRVDAGNRIVEAVGTVFNVERRPAGDIELTVTEGRVRVLRPDTGEDVTGAREPAAPVPVLVAAGEVATIGGVGERIRRISVPDLDAQLAWRRGMLVFRGETLTAALAEVERYTPVRFVLRDPALGQVQVGGYFRTGDVDGVLLALQESFGIETRRISESTIELSSR